MHLPFFVVSLSIAIAIAASSMSDNEPAPAEAGVTGTVSVSGSVLAYVSSPGNNAVSIFTVDSPDRYRLWDSIGSLTAGAGCTQVDGQTADCDLASVASLSIDVGPGDDASSSNSIQLNDAGEGDAISVAGGEGGDVFYTYSSAGTFDPALLGAVTFTGGAGEDQFYFANNADETGRTYAVTATSLDFTGFSGFDATGVEHFSLTSGAGNDTYNIGGTPTGATNISDVDGNEVFAIAAGDLSVLGGMLSISPGNGVDSASVDDSGHASPVDYALSDFEATTSAGEVISLNSPETVVYKLSQGANDVTMSSTSVAPVQIDANGGDDTLTMGSLLELFDHQVTFDGGSGTDTATIADDAVGQTDSAVYTLSSAYLTSDEFAGLSYADVEALALHTSGAQQIGTGDTIHVVSASAGTLVISTHSGEDYLRLGSGTLDGITSRIVVDMGDDHDLLWLDGQFGTSSTDWIYTRDTIDRANFGHVTYENVEVVDVMTGDGDNAVRIGTTEEDVENRLHLGSGNDSVTIAAGGIGLAVTGVTYLYGMDHTTGDSLLVYDGGLAVTDNGGTISTAGRQPIRYAAIESVSIQPSFDSDGDGCSDVAEGGEDPNFGGERDPFDAWDFFDVDATKAIDLNDTLQILALFGTQPGDEAYDPLRDRMAGLPEAVWRTRAAAGAAIGIDLGDALANLQSFGHSCV